MLNDNLKIKVINSVSWTLSSRAITEILQLIITIVLARILSPKDYGIVAMSSSLLVFIEGFSTLGFSNPIVQFEKIERRHLVTAFVSMLMFNILLYLLVFAVSPYVAKFYNEDILINVLRVTALSFIITAFNTVPIAILERSMQYKHIAMANIFRKLIIGIVAIVMAVKGQGVWSLVLAGQLGNLMMFPLLLRYSKWKPEIHFDKSAFKEMFRYGASVTGSGILTIIVRNVDNMIVGKYLGATALGYYSMAYDLMLKPIDYIMSNVGRVYFPALSSIKSDISRIYRAYSKLLEGISLFTFPIATGLFFLAPVFIEVIYGKKWLPAVDTFRIICFLGAIQSIGICSGILFLSLGRTDLHFRYKLAFTPIYILSYFIGVRYGIEGVAAAYTIVNVFLFIWPQISANRLISMNLKTFFRQMFPATASSIGMYLLLFAMGYIQYDVASLHVPLKIYFLESVFMGIIIYLSILYFVKKDIIIEISNAFKGRVG